MLQIYKKNNEFYWKNDYLELEYGIPTKCKMMDMDKIKCFYCDNLLVNIKENYNWMYVDPIHCCSDCYIVNEPEIKEKINKKNDLNGKIPFKIVDLHNSILNHRNYNKLDRIIKMQFEECIRTKVADNNKFSRDLWFHLYHGKEKPL